ncbi:MAG: calcium-binding protein, partial [Gammaproteobacteria bacterium]|nr:calcium-binding protein [Gammaproteobacteria bacterium]
EGADSLTLWNDATTVDGLGGDDIITGNGIDTTISGGLGNDTITDSGGNDVIDGGAGDDTITNNNGNDTIIGGSGDDTITVDGTGTNMVSGGDGLDTIDLSYSSSNTVTGGSGDDVITVENGVTSTLRYANDTYSNSYEGGQGNDIIYSGASTDTYIFNRGDGSDTIRDYGYAYGSANTAGQDKIIFGAGILVSDVTATRVGNSVVLSINDPNDPLATDQITIENWHSGTYWIESFEFADGTTLNSADVSNLSMVATEGADSLTLWNDATTVDGLGGDDIITGNGIDTTISGGLGNDTITDSGG